MPAIVYNTPTPVEKPWGFELIFVEEPEYTAKMIGIKPGGRCSLQKHEQKKETIFVTQGRMTLHTQDDDGHKHIDDLEEGASFTLLPGTIHRMANDGKDFLLYQEVSTTFPDDVIRIEDDYGR
jgi:mannose-6-phosphate isomerase-like protein (cupin superfamily)